MARRTFSAKLDANMVCKIPNVCRSVELQQPSSRLSNLEGEPMHATFKVSGAACLVGHCQGEASSERRQAALLGHSRFGHPKRLEFEIGTMSEPRFRRHRRHRPVVLIFPWRSNF